MAPTEMTEQPAEQFHEYPVIHQIFHNQEPRQNTYEEEMMDDSEGQYNIPIASSTNDYQDESNSAIASTSQTGEVASTKIEQDEVFHDNDNTDDWNNFDKI